MKKKHLLPMVGAAAVLLSWTPLGCMPTGGSPMEGAGGAETGGTTGSGGTQSTGGTTTSPTSTSGSGGTRASGGTTSTGGAHANGGTTSTGGTQAGGGTTAEGGTSGSGGTTMTTRRDASVLQPDLAPPPDSNGARRDGGGDVRDGPDSKLDSAKRDVGTSSPDLKAGRS